MVCSGVLDDESYRWKGTTYESDVGLREGSAHCNYFPGWVDSVWWGEAEGELEDMISSNSPVARVRVRLGPVGPNDNDTDVGYSDYVPVRCTRKHEL